VALKRSSLNLQGDRVVVAQSATEVGGKLIYGTTKTHRARTIVVPRFVSRSLMQHVELGNSDDFVFTAPNGGPLRGSNFRQSVWTPVVKEFSGERPELSRLRIQDLRHTAASLAISAGGNIKAVQRMLGHKKASMTLDRYGHLYTEDLEDLAHRLDEKFRNTA
jgi:integrase